MTKMTNKSNCTYTLTKDRIDELKQMKKETHISYSKLLRLFISHFYKNPDELLELIEDANDIE